MQMRKSAAFTMIEIMVVLGIIGVLLVYFIPPLMRRMGKSDIKITKLKMNSLKNSLMEYKQDVGHYPNKKEGGLEALLNRPSGSAEGKWEGPYVDGEDSLEDSWGNPFEYNSPPEKYRGKPYKYFEIISPGDPSDESNKEIHVGA